MAKRLIFVVEENKLKEKEIEFEYYTGFALTQKQKSIFSLHNEIKKIYNGNILEISSKSPDELGVKLSAFNLKVKIDGKDICLENILQASKVFQYGGPYIDLLTASPIEAKKDERIKNSGRLLEFKFKGKIYSNKPMTAFYDWIYCCALYKNPKLACEITDFNIFTDIEFNHEKSINCQARSAAIFVLLSKLDKLNVLNNYDEFKTFVYDNLYDEISIYGENSLFSYIDK